MITWAVVGALTVGVYGQRVIGAVLVDTRKVSAKWQTVLAAVPMAVIVAVVALQTVTANGTLAIDARLAGVTAAALCAWRRLPMVVTVVAAAATTALVRAL